MTMFIQGKWGIDFLSIGKGLGRVDAIAYPDLS